jgi:hypothetical protein
MQRKEQLHLLQLIRRYVRLAQGRHPEVDEGGLHGAPQKRVEAWLDSSQVKSHAQQQRR